MRLQDILIAKQSTEQFLNANGMQGYIYSNQPPNSFGIYINITTKSISIHSYNSSRYRKSLSKQSGYQNIYNLTDNGLWIASFKTITDVYAYANILSKFLYLQVHEETLVFMADGINFVPYQI